MSENVSEIDLSELPEQFPVEVATPWTWYHGNTPVTGEFSRDLLERTHVRDARGMHIMRCERMAVEARPKYRHCIEHMIRAVNAHDDLVAALKEARKELDNVLVSVERMEVYFDGDEFHERIAKIDAALAKAEAKH